LPEFGRASQPVGCRGHRLLVCPDSPGRSRVYGFRGNDEKRLLRAVGIERLTVLEIRASGQTAVPPSVVTREVLGAMVDDQLLWSSEEGPPAVIPQMTWEEVQRRAGLLAATSFTAALIASTGDEDEQVRQVFTRLLVESGVESDGAIEVLNDIAKQSVPHGTTSPDAPASLLAGSSATGATVRRWLGLENTSRLGVAHEGRGPIKAQDVELLLDVLDPCDFRSYFAWRDIMFACHQATGGSKAGREIFVEWSAGNPEFHGDEWSRQVRSAWQRCSYRRSGAITVATLLKYVDEAGHRALRHEVMRKYEACEDFEDAPISSATYESISRAPVIPFEASEAAHHIVIESKE